MRISIFGTGYVGLVTGACLAESGNQVICVDRDSAKIDLLGEGDPSIHEPGLRLLVQRNLQAGRLRFSTNAAQGIEHGQLLIIAVGTPPDEDGSANIRGVLDVAKSIGEHIDGHRVVVDKSTVPVGTAQKVEAAIRDGLKFRGVSYDFDVVSNPEFLREGSAINDFLNPDRVIIGTDSPRAIELLRVLYEPFLRNRERFLVMDAKSAELTKYAANAMLATKISFINELAGIAEKVGADIEKVRQGIGADARIGYKSINPGAGYGGSCLPKDVRALSKIAALAGASSHVLEAVERVNTSQKCVLFERVRYFFNGHLAGKVVALWGLSFKPNTDDMREAPSRVLMEALWQSGARIRAYDPAAMPEAKRLYPRQYGSGALELCKSSTEALSGADVLVIVTEWSEFHSPDFAIIRDALRWPAIFDGRNLYEPACVAKSGLRYFAIGRGDSVVTK